MHLIFFHYHVLPGGVTAVIKAMGTALEQSATSPVHIRVVSGSGENTEELSVRWPVDLAPEIGYLSRTRLGSAGSTLDAEDEAADGPVGQVGEEQIALAAGEQSARLADSLWERWGDPGAVWWVHNHHLGKNPVFTRALYRVAELHPEQRMVLHIHDFPESGRFANLRYLRQAGALPLYRDLPNLHYVTINSRDRRILQNAGLTQVSYLPNPVLPLGPEVPPPQADDPPAGRAGAGGLSATVRQQLHAAFGAMFPRFRSDAPLLLYPVRTIRRKNVFEAALLAQLVEGGASLLVTLPGVSQAERQYSSMVQHAFQDGTIPGLWGIGRQLDEAGIDFETLQHAADMVVSSSVQEGFGYQFITPLLYGKAVVARHLDVLEDVLPLYDEHPHHFYRSLQVPLGSPSLSGPQALLRFRYSERLDRLAPHIPPDRLEELHADVDELLGGETIEFSFLLPHMQYTYLKDMAEEPAFRAEVTALNPRLTQALNTLVGAGVAPASEAIERAFGPARHAAHIESILASFGTSGTRSQATGSDPTRIDTAVLRSFTRLEYQRLLYE